ncbi:AzlD domain-containing protein [Euzebya sp.]|uniref:AzlD domain-containing protein n=1 Tax=Euzebya sp. TaxID=1971409 RepID=UPI0035129F46
MTATVVLVGLFAGTYALKAAGPVLLGGRELPAMVTRLAVLLPAALLAGLTLSSTVADGRALTVDARLVGLLAAAAALRLRVPFIGVVLIAAAATAAVRALT